MNGDATLHDSPAVKTATAIKIEDPAILRPDFYQTTKAGGERQRLALACQTCRQKKVKCNGELPKCHRCTNFGIECEYKLTTHRRSRNSGAVEKHERANRDVLSRYRSPKLASNNGKDDWHATQPPMHSEHKRQRSSSASPKLSNMSLPNRHSPRPQNNMHEYPRSTPVSHAAPRQMAGLDLYGNIPDATTYEFEPPLPSRRLVVELCQVYFSRIYGQMYAFLHPPSFMRSVVHTPQLIPPALLLAICALSARFHLSAAPDSLRPDYWATCCLDLILGSEHMPHDFRQSTESDRKSTLPHMRSHFFRPSLSSVQALHLIAFHYFGQGQSSFAWLVAGFALRMAESLQLNREVFDDPVGRDDDASLGHVIGFKHREMRRRTFWALYMMDRLSSAGVHRPFSIRNEDISIQLPVKQECYDREIPSYTCMLDASIGLDQQQLSINLDCGAYMIRIIDVWGEVSRFVQQSASELNWNTGSPLMSLRQKILLWEENLPHSMKYTSSNVRQQNPAWYIMHAAYFLSLCVMHRFALPKSETRQYGVDHIPVPYLNMCVKEAIHNACRVSEIIQMIPSTTKISAPFMGFASFSAATIHAFLGYHVPEMDPLLISSHRGYVHSTLIFLSNLAEAWKPLSKMHDALTSQVNNRPRSDRSNRSSILNESHANQFKVPETLPVKFNSQQQIEMNILAFSTWFDDPVTANKMNPGWQNYAAPNPPFAPNTNVMSYDSKTGLMSGGIGAGGDGVSSGDVHSAAQSQGSGEFRSTRVRTPSASDAPYGEAFPIVNADDSDNDDVAADLLVSFKQSEPRHPYSQDALLEEEYLDHLNSMRDTTHRMSATIDCLQLMKVGVITLQNWT